MKFNEKLKLLRSKKGYTQDDVASKLNISRQSVSKWENGINEPDFETVKKLCIIFDCSIADLIDDDKEVITSKEIKDEKIIKRLFLSNIYILITSILIFIPFIIFMNDNVIIHIDIDGNKIYGSKWLYLFFLLVFVLVFIFCLMSKNGFKNNEMYKKYRLTMQIFATVIQTFISVGVIVFLFFIDNYKENIILSITTLIALSIIIPFGLFSHPKFNNRNPLFGFRTNFTINNEEAWVKINSLSSIVLTVIGFITYVVVIILSILIEGFGVYSIYSLTSLLVVMIPVFIYHEILRKRINAKKEK